MATVQVTVLNNSNQSVSLTLDDEHDAEQIEYLKALKRREDLADVDVKPVAAKRATAKPSPDAGDPS